MTSRDEQARAAAKERWGDHTEPFVGFMDGVHWADAHRPIEPDEDNWEYGIRFGGSEQRWASTTREHIEYIAGWHNGIYEFARRRRGSEWEPITPGENSRD